MSQNQTSANFIKVNPVNVLWRIEAMEQIQFAGATGSPNNNKTIHLFLNTGVEHYFWVNYNSGGSDPMESGTAHAVAVASGAADTAIAADFVTAINLVTGFVAHATGTLVTVCRTLDTGCGQVTAPTCSLVAPVVLTQIRQGQDFNLGLLKGDLGPKFAPQNLTVTAHQFGKTPLSIVNQGFGKIEASLKLMETDASKLNTLFGLYGGAVAGASTTVNGAGTAVLGSNILVKGARLIFKPVNASDNTQNFVFALAIPVPDTMTFSGENPNELSVMFEGVADLMLNTKINAVFFGDCYQTGLTSWGV